jgi:hypothetical protein
VIINLFAYRANSSDALPSLPKPIAVGPVNDQILEAFSQRCAVSVAAWGNRGALYNRSQEVRSLFSNLQCVTDPTGRATTNRGEPFHPSRRAQARRPHAVAMNDWAGNPEHDARGRSADDSFHV